MKILQIHHSLAGGGVESMVCGLANEMIKTEDVTVCSIFEPKPTDVFWYKLDPRIKKITLGKSKEGFSLKELFLILSTIRNNKYNVVHVHSKFYYYALSVLFLHRKTKFFYTVHSDAKMENLGWDEKFFPWKKYCFRKAHIHPVTISNTSQKSFDDLYNCHNDLVYNGVPRPVISSENPVAEFRLTDKTKLFIHAGRVDTPKNQLVLCKVFNRLIQEGHDIVLLIAGSKQKKEIFTSLEPYLCDRIKYLGERNDIPQIMAHCDAMCLPSIWEGLPVTLLEALSVGCIPICSNVGGIPDVIESGMNGFLSKSSSEYDYYNTMCEYLLKSENEYEQIRRNCKRSFENYDIVNTTKSYLALYKAY